MRLTFPNANTERGHAQVRLLNEERLMRPTTRMNLTPLAMLSAVLLIAGFASVANAAPIALVNPGFEYPAGPDGVLDDAVNGSDPSTGWIKTGGGQIYNPGLAANAPEGSNSYLILNGVAGYNLGSGYIQQVLDDVLRPGTYTLEVEVGENATDASVFGDGYAVELGVMDGLTFRMLADDPTPVSPSNSFATSSAELTVSDTHADLGLPLAIRLSATVAASGNNQVLFDDVRLNFVATPADVDVYLQTQAFDKALPGGGAIPMWGFALCSPGFASCALPADSDAPGPQINAFEGSTLRVHVRNTLSVPVSIVVPGQSEANDGAPVMMASAPDRVQSFTHETTAGADETYTWNNLRAGTYLYQSGTFPSIQVPMGLYGALVVAEVNAGVVVAEAYGHAYDAEAVLLLSEIDPIQNARVDASAAAMPGISCVPLAEYEQNMTAGYPCTVDYNPTYFLINGEPTVDLPAGDPADTALLRFLNAGLRSHTPSIVGVEMGLIAEDGNAYLGQLRNQSAVLLAAGKTLDAVIAMPNANHTYSLFDRMPTFSNENLPNGGSLANLQVGTGTPPPVTPPPSPAANDVYIVIEDTPLNVGAGAGVLFNDTGLSNAVAVSSVAHGTLECVATTTTTPGICSDGSFTYTPNTDYSGPDSFTYSADGATSSYGAQVMLNVSFVNDLPAAADDTYTNNIGSAITVAAPGVLGNDMDADGDPMFAVLASGTATLNPDGSFTAAASGVFTYISCDRPLVAGACPAGSASAVATVNLTVNPASNIALNVQEPDGTPVTDYRWTVEEDTTWHPDPNVPGGESLATTFHKSYMPVVAQGCVGATACSADETQTPFTSVALDPTRHYYVSVLPADAVAETDLDPAEDVEDLYRVGHTVGGAQIPPGATSVTVNVNKEPLPYAQISIFIFNDNGPTNGAVDANEAGLGGFQITLEDAGGRYGISAGAMSQDADGNPLTNALDCFGGAPPLPGVILSCPDTPANQAAGLVGQVLIKNLFPAKYGIITTAPQDPANSWVQTSTIEGTKVIDAWVKAGEPPYFSEFGPVGVHAFVGFVSPESINLGRTGSNEITGAVTNFHMSRPPVQTLWDSESYDALAHTRPWIGLNSNGGLGPNIAAVQADLIEQPDGRTTANFTIPNVPNGDYQIVVWDSYLDQVIAYRSVSFPDPLNPSFTGNVGNIPVFNWFARMENHVFLDENGNGIREDGEGPLPEQAVNLRWRDGSVYQSFPTDLEGFVPFDQVFPFFNWLVAEVDYTRFEATGLTVTVDHGGDVRTTGHVYNPQVQADGALTRTETGQVLTHGFQGFLGQTSVYEWGKRPYEPGVNGGISGIVYYGVTRAENDPRLAAAEPWEPGIARVPVRLYRVVNREASSIDVVNAGFEQPGSRLTANPMPGWTKTDGGNIFQPGNAANAPEGVSSYIILDGTFSGFSLGSGSVQQELTDVLAEGSYTLTVQVGENVTPDSVFGTGYQVQLGVNHPLDGFVVLAEDNSSLAPSNGFLTSTVQYTADAGDANLGYPLVIRLAGQVAAGFNNQVLFDDVRLDYSTTGLALVEETVTDSWDDSLPEDCPGADANDYLIVGGPSGPVGKCYDGLRNFNQARPAVFDGGYAFNDIPAGEYVVEVVPPAGYELLKEEDVNVSFGDGYASVFVTMPGGAVVPVLPDPAMVAAAMAPEPGLAQPPCVGELRTVPDTMSLFPAANAEAPFRGAVRPLCDRKRVILSDQGQAAADFTLLTHAPIAAHFTGMVLDDVAQEFNPLSPQFGEKWAPPFVPVSIRDYKGAEISRVYSDQWGRINGLMPSTFTANMPSPSGFSPAMHMTCMNDPGPILDTDAGSATFGQMITDPQYNPGYSNFCYTFQYMPGTTTYLDTPVLPVSAFASGYNPPDCSLDDATPMISRVRWNANYEGPWIQTRPAGAANTTRVVDLRSMGRNVEVPNPAYEGPLATGLAGQKTITRDFDFGPGGATTGTVTLNGIPLTILSWNRNRIQAQIDDATVPTSGQLVVTRGDNGNSTTNAVTLTVSADAPIRVPADQPTIQAAIDAANPGDLILVAPGVYNESVIMWKPVRLQGAGAGVTMINAVRRPTDSLLEWRAKMDSLFAAGLVDSLPNQPEGAAGYDVSEGAAVTVVGPSDPNAANSFSTAASRIDGFSITGADVGGGVLVNSYAHNLVIANNSVYGNNGSFHGGVRVGVPFLELADAGPYAFNTNVNIHHNAITNNGGLGGAGGGLSIATGSDSYTVSDNFVCGNFTTGDGGGIGHIGLSNNGQILRNRIEFNQNFNQAVTVSGGGVFIGGEPVVVEFVELDNPNSLSMGSGSVDVDFNLIRGNQAGAGHGGGIRTQFVNGQDIVDNNGIGQWYQIRIRNNVIANNVTGWAGAGVSLKDTVRSVIRNNTIAHNDSTATVGGLVVNNLSANQPSGIATALHSAALAAAIPVRNNTADIRVFSNPDVGGGSGNSNTLWENRSFHYDALDGTSKLIPVLDQALVGQCVAGATFWDLDPLLGGALTSATTTKPASIPRPYCNGGRTLVTRPGQIFPLPALDEGGNAWIDVRFGPLTRAWPVGSLPWAYR